MSLKRLKDLGFNESDCISALNMKRGDVELAASWLLVNAKPIDPAKMSTGSENKSRLSGFEVK